MDEEVRIYKVPSDNLGTLKDKFVQLGRRAKRLGLPAPTFTEIKVERKEVKNPHTGLCERVYLVHHLVVDPGCSVVKVEGWTFIATIQHTEEGNILRAVGNADIPSKYRQVSQLCEHCNTTRNRKDTYILRNEDTGAHKQVGRNCLADFFGHDALMYAERAQYLCDIDSLSESMEDSFGFGGGGGPRYEPLEWYLPHVAECIRLKGWMSRGRAKDLDLHGSATCEVAADHLHPKQAGPHFRPLYTHVSEESVKVANDAIEWATNIEGEEIPDYLHNIRTIARRMVWEGRDMGLAASIVAAYQRHLSKLRWAEMRARRAEVARYVGEVGDKIRVAVNVEKVVQCYGTYGTSFLHIMSDSEGNVYIWFASSQACETGKDIVLQGTIKAHNEREGVKQNVLTRCAEVLLKNYICVLDGEVHRFTAACTDEVKKALRAKLSLKRLPAGTRIIEDVPQGEEAVA